MRLYILDKLFVVGVRAYPEPDYVVMVDNSQCPPANANTYRINGWLFPYTLELKAGGGKRLVSRACNSFLRGSECVWEACESRR